MHRYTLHLEHMKPDRLPVRTCLRLAPDPTRAVPQHTLQLRTTDSPSLRTRTGKCADMSWGCCTKAAYYRGARSRKDACSTTFATPGKHRTGGKLPPLGLQWRHGRSSRHGNGCACGCDGRHCQRVDVSCLHDRPGQVRDAGRQRSEELRRCPCDMRRRTLAPSLGRRLCNKHIVISR